VGEHVSLQRLFCMCCEMLSASAAEDSDPTAEALDVLGCTQSAHLRNMFAEQVRRKRQLIRDEETWSSEQCKLYQLLAAKTQQLVVLRRESNARRLSCGSLRTVAAYRGVCVFRVWHLYVRQTVARRQHKSTMHRSASRQVYQACCMIKAILTSSTGRRLHDGILALRSHCVCPLEAQELTGTSKRGSSTNTRRHENQPVRDDQDSWSLSPRVKELCCPSPSEVSTCAPSFSSRATSLASSVSALTDFKTATRQAQTDTMCSSLEVRGWTDHSLNAWGRAVPFDKSYQGSPLDSHEHLSAFFPVQHEESLITHSIDERLQRSLAEVRRAQRCLQSTSEMVRSSEQRFFQLEKQVEFKAVWRQEAERDIGQIVACASDLDKECAKLRKSLSRAALTQHSQDKHVQILSVSLRQQEQHRINLCERARSLELDSDRTQDDGRDEERLRHRASEERDAAMLRIRHDCVETAEALHAANANVERDEEAARCKVFTSWAGERHRWAEEHDETKRQIAEVREELRRHEDLAVLEQNCEQGPTYAWPASLQSTPHRSAPGDLSQFQTPQRKTSLSSPVTSQIDELDAYAELVARLRAEVRWEREEREEAARNLARLQGTYRLLLQRVSGATHCFHCDG